MNAAWPFPTANAQPETNEELRDRLSYINIQLQSFGLATDLAYDTNNIDPTLELECIFIVLGMLKRKYSEINP